MSVNIDWSIYLRIGGSRIGRTFAPLMLRGDRLRSFQSMTGDIVAHTTRGRAFRPPTFPWTPFITVTCSSTSTVKTSLASSRGFHRVLKPAVCIVSSFPI